MEKTSVLNGCPYHDMAVIMTAYQDFSFIKYNVEHLHKGFDVYIHVDKKRAIPQEFIDYCRALRNIWIDSRFRINWGGVRAFKSYSLPIVLCIICEGIQKICNYE